MLMIYLQFFPAVGTNESCKAFIVRFPTAIYSCLFWDYIRHFVFFIMGKSGSIYNIV